jgi:flagellar biosynthesis chaperone FliJ
MKKFHFRLEQVLNFFRQQELVQSMTVAQLERRVADLEQRRDLQVANRDVIENDIRDRHHELQHDELKRSYAHADYLTRSITVINQDIESARAHRDREREHLLALSKRRQVVDELKSRKRVAYDAEMERHELAFLDELNTRRFPVMSALKEDVS